MTLLSSSAPARLVDNRIYRDHTGEQGTVVIMASYGLGFSHSEISEKCDKITRKKRSKKGLKSLWSKVKQPDTFLTITTGRATKPETKILGGRYP